MRFVEHRSYGATDGVRVLAAAPEAKADSVAPFAVHVALKSAARELLHGKPGLLFENCPSTGVPGPRGARFDVDGVVFIEDGDDEAAVARAAVRRLAGRSTRRLPPRQSTQLRACPDRRPRGPPRLRRRGAGRRGRGSGRRVGPAGRARRGTPGRVDGVLGGAFARDDARRADVTRCETATRSARARGQERGSSTRQAALGAVGVRTVRELGGQERNGAG